MRETLLAVNLQAKIAPSHTGANHLLSLTGLIDEGSGNSTELSKINNFHFKDKTFFIFSHFHANYCTDGKPITEHNKSAWFFIRISCTTTYRLNYFFSLGRHYFFSLGPRYQKNEMFLEFFETLASF